MVKWEKKDIRRADEIQHSPHIHEPLICIRKKHEQLRVHVCTEIVRSETFLYSSLCRANVTFITDQMGRFNCNVCLLAARAIQVMNCPRTQEWQDSRTTCRLPGADAIASDRARDMWSTR